MKTLISDQEKRFEYELLVFENEVHEAMRCFYIWRALKKAAPKSQKLFHQSNRNAEFWNTVDNSVQSNSLIVVGRIFDEDSRTNSVGRLLDERMELMRVLLPSSLCAEFHPAFFLLALHSAGRIRPPQLVNCSRA